jgi:predicted esterase
MRSTHVLAVWCATAACAGDPAGEAAPETGTTALASASDASSETTTSSSGSSDGATGSTGSTSTTGSTGTSTSTSTGAAGCNEPPVSCPTFTPGSLATVTDTAVGPYLLRVAPDRGEADVVLFMPGGPGSIDTAMPTYELWLSAGDGLDDFTVVVPYADDGNVQDERERVLSVLDEVLACSCGSGRVHLGGTSLGGLSAFAMMVESPDRFVTLLGAPGSFDSLDADVLGSALAGKAVFNGVGEDDAIWHADVMQTHAVLAGLGIDSTFVEFPGQGHILTQDFDETIFFEFWSSH